MNQQRNTRIKIEYNGPHEKAEQTVILPGAITQDQVATIRDNLMSQGDCLIAHAVGLPTPSESTRNFPQAEDHPYSQLADWSVIEPSAGQLLTTDTPTTDLSIDDLVDRIRETNQRGWDAPAEEARLKLNPIGYTDKPMNTRIELEYRTATDSASEIIVLAGAITQAQADQITSNMIDEFQVIAHQIGLPTPSESLAQEREFPDSEDHLLTNFSDWLVDTPMAESLHTTDTPTHDLPITELADRIEQIGPEGWDFLAEDVRLGGIPAEDSYDSPSL